MMGGMRGVGAMSAVIKHDLDMIRMRLLPGKTPWRENEFGMRDEDARAARP
jgi:hypothetical protein